MSNLKKNIFYRTVLVSALTLSQLTLFAQDEPGDLPSDGCDPFDTSCATPLDTWVYVLVALALYFAYRHLKKQKLSIA